MQKKKQNLTNFHNYWPTLSPGNRTLMAIKSWNIYTISCKENYKSLEMALSQINQHLWTKNAKKISKMINFHCF